MKTKKTEKSLDFLETEMAIKLVKDTFEKELAKRLSLVRVTAPRFLIEGTGLQDDLAGTQIPVSFKTKFEDKKIEVVHSLAKWKRHALGRHKFKADTGIYTDMDAIRKDEDVDDIHSIYVDQWDWEKVITKKDRSIIYLKETVEKIYSALLETEKAVLKEFSFLEKRLPEKVTFFHSEELEEMYPRLSPKQREYEISKKYGAVFIIGIGRALKSGTPHELRAADYDDWTTVTDEKKGYHGLNGDLIVWDDLRQREIELSSMGIRVDAAAMKKQLALCGLSEREMLDFHKGVISDKIPLSIGGGIGQSRICMFLLHKKHIGEVQSSVWPEQIKKEAEEKGLILL
ncbi:MAG: aspartate--ammonia ligase [Candidatus Nanoarchaeia archaeon]